MGRAGARAEASLEPAAIMTQPAPAIHRHVFFVAGFDPRGVDEHHATFRREIARFSEVWAVAADCDAAVTPTATGGAWRVNASHRGADEASSWQSHTRFEVLAWDDIVAADMGRSRLSHAKGTVLALADMIASGTIVRYFRTSHRYGIFFVMTYLLLAACLGAAAIIGLVSAHAASPALGALGAAVLGGTLALGSGWLLTRLVGQRFRLKQSLDLAEFSVDFVRGRHGDLDARIRAFAQRVAEVARQGGVDEIIIAGHSLGAMHAVCLVAQALKDDPAFGHATPVRILTLGSTTAKFALHPAGGRLRQAALDVHAAPHIGWVEYQANDDIVSFYKVDPVTLGPTEEGDPTRRPLVRRVNIDQMLTPPTYRRFRLDVMRLHCQFFLANDQRAPYDFFAFICAPVRFEALTVHPAGPLVVFAPDGSLNADARAYSLAISSGPS